MVDVLGCLSAVIPLNKIDSELVWIISSNLSAVALTNKPNLIKILLVESLIRLGSPAKAFILENSPEVHHAHYLCRQLHLIKS